MKLPNQFSRFHSRVAIDQSRKDRIISAHQTLRAVLERDSEVSGRLYKTFLQGSYANSTAVRPLDGEYDVDVVVCLNEANFRVNQWGASSSIQGPYQVLSWLSNRIGQHRDYQYRVKKLTRCIRVDYSGDFHMDVVPTLATSRDARPLSIGDSSGYSWANTDPEGLLEWYRAQNRRTDGNFNRVLRALKRWRDITPGVDVPSITMAVMLGRGLPSSPRAGTGHADWLIEAFSVLETAMRGTSSAPTVTNPSLPSEDLGRDWSAWSAQQFGQSVRTAHAAARQAGADPYHVSSSRLWQGLLGTDFPLS